MNNLKNLLLVALFFITVTLLAQTKISGIVLDEIGQPLPGASVVEKGTSNGTSTDFDGKFMLNVKSNKGVAIVSFVGYKNSYINFTGGDLGKIKLSPDENKLEEIVITATSLAIDRKTPVAVSTLKAEEIERKLGSQEFVEVLKSTPGVYATKAGGGFGDGELRLRGFTSENVGVLINGVPVNDPGSGRVFWSNWAGLGDVTSLFQVQRGLGASKVAIPSIGGTLNIITKTTDVKKGGNVILGTGNNGYRKNGFTLSTGKMENDFAATVSVIQTKGDGFVDATPFNAVAYYGSLAYEFNEKHTLSLTSFGTPQEHGQRFNRLTVEQIRNAPNGIRFNSDVAIRNGEMELVSGNFFHKNQTSLNHYWNISDKSSLSTATYFSVGNGGAIFESGDIEYRLGNEFDPLDLDTEVQQNQELALQGLGSDVIINSSRNNHIWFGALSTFQTEINDKLDFLAGADYRNYTVSNFREVLDLLGGDFFEDDSDINNPNRKIGVGDLLKNLMHLFLRQHQIHH